MEAKATRFVTQFSRAVFQQWTQTPEREQFWTDEAFLHDMLEEAAAKLPRGPLKTHLTRDPKPLETQLASLLRELHADYAKKQQKEAEQTSTAHGALLNEELTELELTQAAASPSAAKQQLLQGVLALDAGLDVARHSADAQEENAEQLAQLFALIAARGYESQEQQTHKRGLVLRRLARCVQKQVEALPSNWGCDAESDAGKQVLQLRALLERVVVQDTVELATEGQETLEAPWTKFYRPEESKELKQVDFDAEIAKIYGVLLALAVYYPIESGDGEETSDESSSDDEEEHAAKPNTQKTTTLSALAQAQLTTRQTLLAAQMRQRGLNQNGQWLVSVLSFLQTLSKPERYVDEEEDVTLDEADQRALLDCVGQVYTRAFASISLFDQGNETAEDKVAAQDSALFQAVVCLRNAAHFMRVKRKSSLSAITTAMAHLAGVPLPASFVSWLDKEQSASPTTVLEKAVQRLWTKCYGQTKMVNILLSSTDVTNEELLLIQKSYSDYLQKVAEGIADKSTGQAQNVDPPSAEEIADASSLFYMDNAGGTADTTSKSKKKRDRKKRRAAKQDKVSPSKRSRAESK